MLKPLLVVVATATFGVLSAAVPPGGSQATADHKSTAKSAADSQAKAKKLYEMDCAICHGDKGDGKTDVAKDMGLILPDWSDPKTLAAKTDQELFTVIRNGKDKMPAEVEGRAKNEEINALIVYIRSLARQGAPDAAPPAPAAPAPEAPAAVPPPSGN